MYNSILVKNDKTGQHRDEIIKHYQTAIDKGNNKAMYHCAFFLQHNTKSKEDEEKINNLYKMAADGGNILAMHQYGLILFKSNMKKEAAYYFKLAADSGDIKSIYNYALMLENGNGIERNIDNALIYYKKGYEKGYFNSMNNYAYIIFKNNIDKIKAVQIFKICADNGNKYAMCNYAYACNTGQGTDINKNEAIKYYKKSIEHDYTEAMIQYGRILELSKGENNIQQAADLYKMAAKKGNIDGMNNLISLLLKSYNIEISKEDIIDYCKKSIAEGKIVSMIFYAKYLMINNRNDPNSKKESMNCIKRAADLGNVYSMYKYSKLLYIDFKNMENSDTLTETQKSDILAEMKKYLLRAVAKNNIKAMNLYSKILKLENWSDIKVSILLMKAADLGSIKSMIKYVKMHNYNSIILCDYGIIKKFLKEAIKKPSENLINLLLRIIINEKIKLNYDHDMVTFIQIASDELNIPVAMYIIGSLLINGKGFKKDYEKGIDYIKKAADKGVLEAMRDYSLDNLSKKGIVDYNAEYFLKGINRYETILMDYKNDKNKVFVDDEFLPNKSWRRIDEIYKEPLFKKEIIDQNFIKQGSIGNCYLISFLSRVAKQHYLIKTLFEHELPDTILGEVEDSINIKCGAVVIYFYAFGRKIPVLIDTLIPMKNDIPLYSRPSDIHKSAWFCLVEKAYAKLCGSYYNTDSGWGSFPAYSFFSYYSKAYEIKESNPNLFTKFMKYQEKGYIIDASIIKNIAKKGLYRQHSYTILKIREVDNKRVFILRNPWGSKEYQGECSIHSSFWTPRLKKLLDYDHCQMGTFHMTDEEFFKYFDIYTISKPILPEWNIKNFSYQFTPGINDGINGDNTFLINHQSFAFQVTDPLPTDKKFKIHINVEICNSTFQDKMTKKDIRVDYLVLFGHTNGKKFDENTYKDNSLYFSMIGLLKIQSFKHEVNNNETITILIHRITKKDYVENCYVSVFCEYNFKLYDIDHQDVLIPETPNPGIAFDNYTISFPNISRPLVLDYFKDRLIINFGSDTSQNDISKFFQYMNKKIGSLHVDLNDYEIDTNRNIGKGSNGNVYAIREKKTNKLYAAKISNHEITKKNVFFRELLSHWSIKYPSIVDYKGFSERNFNGEPYPIIITEYLNKGNLYDLLMKEKNGSFMLTNTNKMIFVIRIALGMEYIHRNKIIHRDLKFHNIVLDDNLYPNICDFSESKSLDKEIDFNNTIIIGTKLFMAPEIAKNDGNYSYPVDVYSYGIMLYYIYTNQVPEDPINIKKLDKKYQKFICNLIDSDPNKRPTFRQIIDLLLTDKENTWIDNVDQNKVEIYLHKFGLSMKQKSQVINFDIISSINEDIYPSYAKKPKFIIQQLMENELIPKQIRDDIELAENIINNFDSIKEKELDETGNYLYKIAQYFFSAGDKSIFNIQEDLYYCIKYLKAAALCKHKRSINTLAYLFSNDSNPNIQKIAFNIACLDADLDDVNGFNILGFFYKIGIGTKSNIAMSAINFKIAADFGDVESMTEYANILSLIGQQAFDINKLESQIKDAEMIIQKMDGKKNYIYNEIRLTIDTLKNETAALYVSLRYYEKAAKYGNEEIEEKISLIKTILAKYENYPQYFDDLYKSLE